MPLQQITECDDCGHTYDPTVHASCPKCWDKFCDEQNEQALEKDEFLELTNTKL